MIAWYWLIVAFLLGMAFVALTNEWFDYETVVFDIATAVATVVCFIPRVFYCCFIKNVIPGVDPNKFEEVKKVLDKSDRVIHVGGRLYLWIDKNAQKIWHKIFFVRIKNTKAKE